MQNRRLTDLRNIGKKIASRLNEIGIFTEDDLRGLGPALTHQKLKARYPDETLPVCYYLYAFEGALCDRHWKEIGDSRKQVLLAETGQINT
ncbi:MAG: TfoX/Sxy family protein [Gammaproteobacteria bacterium]|nr:TfoX/Sxy family protein [Gammaproteobacteria bacterium]